jgi:type 1 fimbria pilin
MKFVTPIRAMAAAALMSGVFAASTAVAAPDGTIHFSGGSVAFLASINWGGGTLHYKGRSVPLKVNGIGVGAIGADKFSADGEVFNLKSAHDIEGTYTALNASATAGGGEGAIDMRNEKGVEIRAHSTSAGLKLSLAPTGVVIKFK